MICSLIFALSHWSCYTGTHIKNNANTCKINGVCLFFRDLLLPAGWFYNLISSKRYTIIYGCPFPGKVETTFLKLILQTLKNIKQRSMERRNGIPTVLCVCVLKSYLSIKQYLAMEHSLCRFAAWNFYCSRASPICRRAMYVFSIYDIQIVHTCSNPNVY